MENEIGKEPLHGDPRNQPDGTIEYRFNPTTKKWEPVGTWTDPRRLTPRQQSEVERIHQALNS